MASVENAINILLPSNVDIDNTFISKVKRLFDVDLKFSTEELSEEDQKLGIWFNLFGNCTNTVKAKRYVIAAKGPSEMTTNNIFEFPSDFFISSEMIEHIEMTSCACLVPSQNEIIIISSDGADCGIALSLLEEESNWMPTNNVKKRSYIKPDEEDIEENIKKQADDEKFVVFDFKNKNDLQLLSFSSATNGNNCTISGDCFSFNDKIQILPINQRLQNIELNPHMDKYLEGNGSADIIANDLKNIPNFVNFSEINLPNRLLQESEPPSKFYIKETSSNKQCHHFIKNDTQGYKNPHSVSTAMTTAKTKYAPPVTNMSELDNWDDHTINAYSRGQQNQPLLDLPIKMNSQNNRLAYRAFEIENRLNFTDHDLMSLSGSSDDESAENNTNGLTNLEPNLNQRIYSENDLRYIVIDGSNVAMTHGKNKFSCRGIQITVDYFLKRGHKEITVIVPQARRKTSDHTTSQPQILENLYQKNYLLFSPTREINGRSISSYDDRYILDIACKEKAVIVSNDNYRDLYQEHRPEWNTIIEDRILTYAFHGDDFMPPEDPLGRLGPTLEDFLRHKNVNCNQKFQQTIKQMQKNKLKRKKNKCGEQINVFNFQPRNSNGLANASNLQSNFKPKELKLNIQKTKNNSNIKPVDPTYFLLSDYKTNMQMTKSDQNESYTNPNTNRPNYQAHCRSPFNNTQRNRSSSHNSSHNNLSYKTNSRPESVTKALKDQLLQIFSERHTEIDNLLLSNPYETDFNYFIYKILDL